MPIPGFMPNASTKRLWLYTRKSPRTYTGGVTLPGLFETHNFWLDSIAVSIIIMGEIYGLYNLWAVSHGSFRFAFVVGLFAVDLLLAIVLHLLRGPELMAENRATAQPNLTNDDRVTGIRFKQQAKRYRYWRYPFYALMIFAALFKIISFYGLQGTGFNGVTLAIVVSYIVVAVLQIESTGYFGSELLLRWRLRSQERRYIAGERAGFEAIIYPSQPFAADTGLVEYNIGNLHFIQKAPNPADGYVIRATGVLMDDQLFEFNTQQDTDARKHQIAIHGLRLQLEILEA